VVSGGRAGGERPPVQGDELYLGDAIHFFLSAKRAGGRSERTVDEYRKKLDLFQRWAAKDNFDLLLTDVRPDEVESYVVHLKGRGLSDSSRKNHLAVIRSFFDTLARRLDLDDPTRRLDEVRFHKAAPKRSYLTRREADLLLATVEREAAHGAVPERASGGAGAEEGLADAGEDKADDGAKAARRRAVTAALAARDHAAFSVMIYAGLRIEEAAALGTGDLSFSRGAEEVRVARGKGNKERVVPMGPKLRKSLRRYVKSRTVLTPAGRPDPPHLFLNEKGARVTENTLRRRLYAWVRKSGLKKAEIKPHDLRRTFGTWYLQENPGQVRELAELMGHADLSQVMKYALSDEQRARAGVAKL
jgi:integrase/recombinase XerD